MAATAMISGAFLLLAAVTGLLQLGLWLAVAVWRGAVVLVAVLIWVGYFLCFPARAAEDWSLA